MIKKTRVVKLESEEQAIKLLTALGLDEEEIKQLIEDKEEADEEECTCTTCQLKSSLKDEVACLRAETDEYLEELHKDVQAGKISVKDAIDLAANKTKENLAKATALVDEAAEAHSFVMETSKKVYKYLTDKHGKLPTKNAEETLKATIPVVIDSLVKLDLLK